MTKSKTCVTSIVFPSPRGKYAEQCHGQSWNCASWPRRWSCSAAPSHSCRPPRWTSRTTPGATLVEHRVHHHHAVMSCAPERSHFPRSWRLSQRKRNFYA
jgi:hypothetical protein